MKARHNRFRVICFPLMSDVGQRLSKLFVEFLEPEMWWSFLPYFFAFLVCA